MPNLDAGKITSGTLVYGRLPVGTGANTVAAGDDPRFSNARTPGGSAGGDLSGSYPNPMLKSSATDDTQRAVTTDHIKDSAVTTAKIASSAITTENIADSSVTNAKLAGSIAPGKIASDASNRFVSDAEKTDWNNAVSWGNHATAGYLTSASWASPGSLGATTPAAGTFTTLQANTELRLKDNDATANYVSLRAADTMTGDISCPLRQMQGNT